MSQHWVYSKQSSLLLRSDKLQFRGQLKEKFKSGLEFLLQTEGLVRCTRAMCRFCIQSITLKVKEVVWTFLFNQCVGWYITTFAYNYRNPVSRYETMSWSSVCNKHTYLGWITVYSFWVIHCVNIIIYLGGLNCFLISCCSCSLFSPLHLSPLISNTC